MVLITAIGLSVLAWASARPAIILSQPVAFSGPELRVVSPMQATMSTPGVAASSVATLP